MTRLVHLLGGDACREYLGKARGNCGAPAVDGLCDDHEAQRRRELARREPDGRLSRL